MSYEGSEKNPISIGPWGGQDGVRWDDGVFSTVRQFVIAHGAGIDSIQVEYDLKGSSIWSDKHGGIGGIKSDKVKLDFPNEFLTSIHGHYGSLNEWGPIFIRSLTFESNRKTYGPFGIEQGTHFSIPTTGGKIVGFYGKCGWYIDAIGVYLKPLSKSNTSKALIPAKSNLAANQVEKMGSYTVVQGSIDNGYDIVVAVRQKDDSGGNFMSKYFSKKPSRDSSEGDFKVSSSLSKMPSLYSSEGDFKDKVSSSLSIKPSPYSSDGDFKDKLTSYPSTYIEKGISDPKSPVTPVSYGPWGGNGGTIFDDGIYTGVRQINISRNTCIVSIKVQYDRDGQDIWGSKNGGTGGFRSDKIVFDFPSEILTHITGYYGSLIMMGPIVIKSLTFHTTRKKYGPFGDEQGTFFTTNIREGIIVGFHGTKGLFLDSIGVHVVEGKLPVPTLSPRSSFNMTDMAVVTEVDNPHLPNKLAMAKRGPTEEVAYGVIKEPAPCGPGPWGGDGGKPWDDGVYSGIKQIFVTRGEAVHSIQIEYDRNRQSVWSIKHGGTGGETIHRIKLEYPHEVLTCITGYYGPINRDERSSVIRSLTFYTSRGKYGPYGEEIGTFFTSTTTEGKVVGFHGRSSSYLDAIGVHMQHWLGASESSKLNLFKLVDGKFYSGLLK